MTKFETKVSNHSVGGSAEPSNKFETKVSNHNHERVKLAFSGVKAPKDFVSKVLNTQGNISTITTQRTGDRRISKVFIIAATICLVLGLTVTVIATNFFGLRDLTLPDTGVVHSYERPDGTVEERLMQLIALSGFLGTPEHTASVEWQEFLNTYDVGGAAVAADASGDWGGVPEEFRGYVGVYSLEMAAKLSEIMERHGLALRGEMLDVHTQDELQESIATGPIFTDDSIWFMGYKFSSGTFQFDASYGDISFQFRASRKGVFDEVFLNIRNIEDYTEWNYENTNGTQLLLAQSGYKSLIVVETDVFFIAVNVLAGTDGDEWMPNISPFTRTDLEGFADLINFGQLRTDVPALVKDLPDIERIERSTTNKSVDVTATPIGKWIHVKSESYDRIETHISEEMVLMIYEDMYTILFYGDGAFDNYVRLQPNETLPGHRSVQGLLVHSENDLFELKDPSPFASTEEDFVNFTRGFTYGMSLPIRYDSSSGLLQYTDWDGNHHFFERDS
ncbi:MAG: hypothetical protein LBC71_00820 [Oscillospiraceae bacterium]|jgi:hypothetical protein|nr:hypothetical protein [Oscillospiraceae bacterium]